MSPRRTNLSPLFTWRSAISSPESGLTQTEHHVGLTLSLHMNELGESCFPSAFLLYQETCGRSEATIRNAINRMVELGWLSKTLRVGRGKSNEYEALIPVWYENHLREADLDADVAVRRAAAIAAATAALSVPQAGRTDAPADTENRLREAGSGESRGERETRFSESANPPDPIAKTAGVRRRGRQEGAIEDDSSRKPSKPSTAQRDLDGVEKGEDPAAAEAARDSEVRRFVEQLPGADLDSPRRIVPLAHGLPRRVFLEVAATLEQRLAGGGVRNACGLLTKLLEVKRAEYSAMASAQLLASLGPGKAYRPAPWAIETLKRDDPERYVRILAKGGLPETALGEAIADCPGDHHALAATFHAVRTGAEPGDPIGTPEQERRRWVDTKAGDPGFPLDEIHTVIDAWDDVDDIQRDDLHAHADTTRAAAIADDTGAAAA